MPNLRIPDSSIRAVSGLSGVTEQGDLGSNTIATGSANALLSGSGHFVNSPQSFFAMFGQANQMNTDAGLAMGVNALVSDVAGFAQANTSFALIGDAQYERLLAKLLTNAGAPSGDLVAHAAPVLNTHFIGDNAAFGFVGFVSAIDRVSLDGKIWRVDGMVRKPGGTGTPVIVTAGTKAVVAENNPAGTGTFDVNYLAGAGAEQEYLRINVTQGAGANDVRWVSTTHLYEIRG